MPFSRRNVPPGERWRLPAFVLVNVGDGSALVFDQTTLTVPAYRTLEAVMTIPAWGWLFVATGAVQAGAMLVGRRAAYVNALGVGLILGAALTFVLLAGAYNGTNPWTAPWLPLFYTVSCIASAKALDYSGR